jgi:GT2 family glycosyltransferase
VISIVVLTHNRLALLRRCVEDVLLRTSEKTREIIIWDNASDDGTREFLDALVDPRITVVQHPENIGTNAYARAFELTSQEYLVELDDDVIEAPPRWDQQMLEAFLRIPDIGYLAASLVDDPNDSAARYVRYLREERRAYVRRQVGGFTILEGPTGGGCTMTSRELYERIGGFRQNDKLVFWHEDAAYVRDVHRLGYRSAVLETVKVWHAGSPYYSETSPGKIEFHRRQDRINARKDAVKRLLLRVPLVAALNARYDWFEPPHSYVAPRFDNDDQGQRSDARLGALTDTRREG